MLPCLSAHFLCACRCPRRLGMPLKPNECATSKAPTPLAKQDDVRTFLGTLFTKGMSTCSNCSTSAGVIFKGSPIENSELVWRALWRSNKVNPSCKSLLTSSGDNIVDLDEAFGQNGCAALYVLRPATMPACFAGPVTNAALREL
eukprot:4298659-Alexandrium_andersonii.AAC.1